MHIARKTSPVQRNRGSWLHGFDFLDVVFVSCDEESVAALAVGADFLVHNGGIGLPTVLAVGDGREHFDLEFRILEMLGDRKSVV